MIGDCFAPSTIAAAVYAGYRTARELDESVAEGVLFWREFLTIEARTDRPNTR